MSDIRPDLIDRGIFEMTGRTRQEAGRMAPRLYEGGELPADNPSTLALDAKGNYTDEEASAVAKRVERGGKVRYYVKFSTDGLDRGRILDPRGMYFEPRHLGKTQARKGREKYEFREVGEPAFRDYIQYLASQNATFLRSAERQALNG